MFDEATLLVVLAAAATVGAKEIAVALRMWYQTRPTKRRRLEAEAASFSSLAVAKPEVRHYSEQFEDAKQKLLCPLYSEGVTRRERSAILSLVDYQRFLRPAQKAERVVTISVDQDGIPRAGWSERWWPWLRARPVLAGLLAGLIAYVGSLLVWATVISVVALPYLYDGGELLRQLTLQLAVLGGAGLLCLIGFGRMTAISEGFTLLKLSKRLTKFDLVAQPEGLHLVTSSDPTKSNPGAAGKAGRRKRGR